jgi:two-component sensor histidine kinase
MIGKSEFELRAGAAAAIADEDRAAMAAVSSLRVERKGYLDGSWREFTKTPIRSTNGAVVGLVNISRDITERKLVERERRERDLEQRRALVREIHHRIKNHIQGVAGLLMGHAMRVPALTNQIRAAIAQLQSVAVVHGLQGTEEGRLTLGEMLPAICAAVQGYATGEVKIDYQSDMRIDPALNEDEAVPLALVISELITNAVKHTPRAAGGHTPGAATGNSVLVRLEEIANGLRVSVSNPGRLPAKFDMKRGVLHGSGLRIVRSLLPPQGATLTIAASGDSVCATLELRAPVLIGAEAQDDTHEAVLAQRGVTS